ncbi:hypothetical protein WA158_001758 [Blastocystis sp. Blastoise]
MWSLIHVSCLRYSRFISLDQPFFVINDYTTTIPDEKIQNKPMDKRWSDAVSITKGSIDDFSSEEFLLRVSIKLSEFVTEGCNYWKKDNKVTIDNESNDIIWSTFLVDEQNLKDTASLKFSEECFIKSDYRIRVAGNARPCTMTQTYLQRKPKTYKTPSTVDIYNFLAKIIASPNMMKECIILFYIYVERLMHLSHISLLPCNWRCICLGSIILASKVWNDCPPYNTQFSQLVPQFSLEGINRLEALCIEHLQWNVMISSSLYAKYYFAIRSLDEQPNFRRKHNYIKNITQFTNTRAVQRGNSDCDDNATAEQNKAKNENFFSMSL